MNPKNDPFLKRKHPVIQDIKSLHLANVAASPSAMDKIRCAPIVHVARNPRTPAGYSLTVNGSLEYVMSAGEIRILVLSVMMADSVEGRIYRGQLDNSAVIRFRVNHYNPLISRSKHKVPKVISVDARTPSSVLHFQY